MRNYRPWFITTMLLTVSGIVFSVNFYMQLSATKDNLAFTESQLAGTKTELTTAQDNLDTTQDQLLVTENELVSAKSSLAATESLLISTQGQLTTAQNELASTKSSLIASYIQQANLQTSLTTAQSQITDLQTQLASTNILADPTYAAMQSFMNSDKTNQNTYNVNTYNCVNFSADVIANAVKQHIRCAFINIDFPGTTGHAIIAFNTTDKGMVYIEPQTDEIVNLKVGTHYWQSVIPRPGYYYPQPAYDDTVSRFVVVW
jgi:hypothetical protein